MTSSLPLWWFDDGKAGHSRQIQALLGALGARVDLSAQRLAPWTAGAQVKAWLGARPRPENPKLIIGAGHKTHFSVLAAGRATGAPTLVLMQPSLPLGCFDLCVIPRHDAPPQRANVWVTEGPLSPLKPARERDDSALILVGGPSKHYQWDSAYVWIQLRDLVLTHSDKAWTLSTSRRTPADFLRTVPRGVDQHVELKDGRRLPADWLDQHLPRARCCMVTPDSVSMVFDALSCGVPCALLDLKPKQQDRLTGVMAGLVAQRRVERLGAFLAGTPLPVTAPLREADRIADALVERWSGFSR